ncbi:NADP-dependent oxidoreductase [Alteromonas ponticola]|uniref:NADP-dependent oxidoreductase n=1 Tax=Alteromonas ponticola TaxID=2720613 RepID=A0ABX1QYW6_9ALTE|nr:NADP-dependent oxidoreductase [Alteromonas ponticola]NMH59419.1 NADP-dependent oxidoreductase [Alteromonas ponticola]
MAIHQKWIYKTRPTAQVGAEHYAYEESVLDDTLSANEVLVEARFISVDPYMRIQQSAKANWEAPHPINQIQGAAAVSQVLKSYHAAYQSGDWVSGYTGWQSHARVHGNELAKLDATIAPVETALGVLGMPGRTAWFGLMEAGQPKAGDTLVVSGAAGAVGSLVCQFGIKAGCKVVGIAGSDEKCQWLTTLGVHKTLNYKQQSEQQIETILQERGGVDVYFDNVGGQISDAVLASLNVRARVVICGQISQYNGGLDTPQTGPRLLHHLLYKRASIQGILARDFTHRMPEMFDKVLPWLADESLVFNSTFVEGFEQLPHALSGLFAGDNIGKLIVKV